MEQDLPEPINCGGVVLDQEDLFLQHQAVRQAANQPTPPLHSDTMAECLVMWMGEGKFH